MEQKWIPVEERLPEEHSSAVFAQFKGTDKWRPDMFEKTSHNVLVTAVGEKGKFVTQSRTFDGKWALEIPMFNAMCKVEAWMPLPEPYRTAPQEPHWKDRMMKTFLGGR